MKQIENTNWIKEHHYEKDGEVCFCGLPSNNPLHLQKRVVKQPEGIVEKFENEVASGGIFDIDGNDITDETFIFIQSQADKTREEVMGEVDLYFLSRPIEDKRLDIRDEIINKLKKK
jgi:hypothetical protein